MQPQRLCLTALLTLLATVSTTFGSTPALFSMSQALAPATDARKSPRKALTLPPLKDLPDFSPPPSVADRLLQQGIEHYKNKQLDKAVSALEQALARYQETDNPEVVRQAIGYLATIYRDWGNKQAIKYFQQYLRVITKFSAVSRTITHLPVSTGGILGT